MCAMGADFAGWPHAFSFSQSLCCDDKNYHHDSRGGRITMVQRRQGILHYLTPLVASAAIVLGWAVRTSESTPAVETKVRPIAVSTSDANNADGMSWCRVNGETVNIRVTPNTSNQPVTT